MPEMTASEIRARFLSFFEERGHEVRPSSPLVPGDDPTLLFTNAGMVQFKQVFLGREDPGTKRAVTAQKCVRAGGKHNDLEQVGETARHHTFFEMLGNFSFGDYFKKDAVRYAWEFLVDEMGLDAERLYVTVHLTDDEAWDLWRDEVGVPEARLFRLGDRDNFWQMADTGPCGPCSELHYDLRPEGERSPIDQETFEALGEEGIFIELWNLVFMQYDRDSDGVLHPLPAPSIDTGAGLERLAAVLQGADSNYHTDLFRPLLQRVADVVGRPYRPEDVEGLGYRVLADHARAVAFLLCDGVFPSNEGRGYVLRRILRRGVRHAWLLGRREPTLVHVVEAVVDTMSDAYPELAGRRAHLVDVTRREEERFLATIEGGMSRFDEVAPRGGPDAGAPGPSGAPGVIPGDEAFRLYDTFGFPLDLTELMARERGYAVDVEAFEAALDEQRARSRADRAASGIGGEDEDRLAEWEFRVPDAPQRWVGWEHRESRTRVVALRKGPRLGVILEDNPFYAEAGGQVSDRGVVEGEGWRLAAEDVRKVEGRVAVFGVLEGQVPEGVPVAEARVDAELRHDTERNHTATHLLHAALRAVLGEHVTQRGSLVAPDRLRFDFAHPGPMNPDEVAEVERRVNEAIWADHPVEWDDRVARRGARARRHGPLRREVRRRGACGGCAGREPRALRRDPPAAHR
jgi:alanyl-tRNA synthetase